MVESIADHLVFPTVGENPRIGAKQFLILCMIFAEYEKMDCERDVPPWHPLGSINEKKITNVCFSITKFGTEITEIVVYNVYHSNDQ